MGIIRIGGVPEHFNYMWQLSATKEEFRNFGYYFSFEHFSGGTGAMADALEKNELDIAIMLTEGAVASMAAGKKFKILFPFTLSPLVWGVFYSASRTNQLPYKYEQSKFAISRFFSGSHLMAKFLAQRDNSHLTNDNFVLSQHLQGAREALKLGNADFFLWEKYMTRHLVSEGEFLQQTEIAAPWPAFMLVCNRSYEIKEEEAFKEALINSCANFKNYDINQISEELSKAFNISITDAKQWFSEVKYYDENSYWPDRILTATALMKTYGLIDKLMGLEEMV